MVTAVFPLSSSTVWSGPCLSRAISPEVWFSCQLPPTPLNTTSAYIMGVGFFSHKNLEWYCHVEFKTPVRHVKRDLKLAIRNMSLLFRGEVRAGVVRLRGAGTEKVSKVTSWEHWAVIALEKGTHPGLHWPRAQMEEMEPVRCERELPARWGCQEGASPPEPRGTFWEWGKVRCVQSNQEPLSAIAGYIFRHGIDNLLGNKLDYGVRARENWVWVTALWFTNSMSLCKFCGFSKTVYI